MLDNKQSMRLAHPTLRLKLEFKECEPD